MVITPELLLFLKQLFDTIYIKAFANKRTTSVSSGGLAVKDPALGANGHRFEPRKRSKPFQ